MRPIEFRITQDGTVLSDDPGLQEVLPEALGQVLKVGRLPADLPLVGHCRVGDRWCVFTRDPGERVIRGVALEAAAYAELDYDPFRTAAAHLGGHAVTEAVAAGPVEPPASGRASDAEQPLRAAYGGFLAGEPPLRRAPYLSVLPAGVASEVSPLSRLTAEPPAAPQPGHGAARSWASLPLDRGGDVTAAMPPTAAMPTGADDRLEERVLALEQRLAGTRRTLAIVLPLVLLLGLAGGILLNERIDGVAASSAKITTLAEGLGVEAPPSEMEQAIAAHLHDLSTAAVQSGAWQAVLARRGVEPGPFLNDLMDLGERKQQLLALSSQEGALKSLAGKAATLISLAPAADDLTALAGQREPILQLAQQEPPLTALAAAAPQLGTLAKDTTQLHGLAASAGDLERLAGDRAALTALAARRSALEALAGQATPIQTMVEHGADLMIFWERYGTAMESLAKEQVSLAMLAERYRTIERLVQDSQILTTMAESKPLQSLVKRDDDLQALDRSLDSVLRLADNADALLGNLSMPRRAVPNGG